MHNSGLKAIRVSSLKDIKDLNKGTDGAIIESNTGNKKKIELIKKLEELQIKILNIKNANDYIKKIESQLNLRKEKRKKSKEKKKSSKPKKEKKLTDKLSPEDKKKGEKKEMEKVLTKKK